MKHNFTCLFIFIFLSIRQLSAQNNSAFIGQDAPELKIEKWVKYGGFNSLQKGKVYLIDLWATWCVPCIAGMPHLSQLQKEYKSKGLEVIGITSEDKYGNTIENVKNFVVKKDTAMNYNVAWIASSAKDSEEGIWLHPWMIKSGSNNLPTAFLIDRNGKFVYAGDPSTIDETLLAVINNNYNVDDLKENYLSGINAEKTLSEFNAAIKTQETDSAIIIGKQLLHEFKYVKPNTYLVMGWQVAHIKNDIDSQLLNIGYEAAIRGIKLTNFNSPAFFDVLAGIYAVKKDYLSAVIAEKAAVSLSEGDMKKNQTKNLENYLAELQNAAE
jgi:thiol-disulfide isomerase/thioredoxin